MRLRSKAISTIACILMALLLIGGLAYVALSTERVVPDNPIHPPVERITLPEMLVAPDDSPGEAEGDFETQEPQEQEQQEQPQQQSSTPSSTPTPTPSNESGGEGEQDSPVPSSGMLIDTNLPGANNSNAALYSDDGRVTDNVLSFYIRLGSLANPGDQITELVVYEQRIATNGGSTRNRIELTVNPSGAYTLPLQVSYSYTVMFKVVDAQGNERTEVVDLQGNAVPSSPFTYSFTYRAKMADESDPDIGDHPPVIYTNITDGQEVNAENTLLIRAEDYHGNRIAPGDLYSGVFVTIDGESWESYQTRMMGYAPTINPGSYDSYDLWFKPEYGRDYEEHVIRITAFDDEGNSHFEKFTVIYRHTSEGEVIGYITINVMAPTIGLGTVLSVSGVPLHQGDSLPDVISRELEAQGFTAVFERGDYLAAITSGGMCEGAYIPDDLYVKMTEQDGLTVGSIPYNGLHDLDISQGSGWLYSVDGSSPSNSLGSFHIQDGSTLNLIFTIAWGKDLGRTSGDGGALASYCGSWASGSYVPNHHFENQIEIYAFEPDYATDDYCARVYAYECSVCGAISGQQGAVQTDEVSIEYVSHEWAVESVTDPLDDRDGQIVWVCSHCGRHYTEIIPATGGGGQSDERP